MRLVDQLDRDALVPGELVVLAVDQLRLPEALEIDVLDGLRNRAVELQEQVLGGEVGNPALTDRQVDDVRRVTCSERVVQVVLEGGLMVLPVDLDAGVGRLEAGDRVRDPLVERRREPERPETDLGVGLDALDDGFGRIDGERDRRRGRRRAPRRSARRWARRAACDAGALADGAAAGLQAPTAMIAIRANARLLFVCITPPSSPYP